jgi:predicted O-methyltransferase YrrM
MRDKFISIYSLLPIRPKRFLEDILMSIDIIRIKINLRNEKTINDILKLAYKPIFHPQQIKEEIRGLLLILDKVKPKLILEIGTMRGGTLFLFSNIAHEEATLISVDLQQYPLQSRLIRSIFKKKQKIYLIQGDSHNIETLKKIKAILKDNKVDFLFIDGDHSYEGVKKDFEMYSPLVRKDGIIAFHDIVPSGYPTVYKFWNQVKEKYEYLEIVKDRNQNCYGIGIIFIK